MAGLAARQLGPQHLPSGMSSGAAKATFRPSSSALAEITDTTRATPSDHRKHRRARGAEINVTRQDQRRIAEESSTPQPRSIDGDLGPVQRIADDRNRRPGAGPRHRWQRAASAARGSAGPTPAGPDHRPPGPPHPRRNRRNRDAPPTGAHRGRPRPGHCASRPENGSGHPGCARRFPCHTGNAPPSAPDWARSGSPVQKPRSPSISLPTDCQPLASSAVCIASRPQSLATSAGDGKAKADEQHKIEASGLLTQFLFGLGTKSGEFVAIANVTRALDFRRKQAEFARTSCDA